MKLGTVGAASGRVLWAAVLVGAGALLVGCDPAQARVHSGNTLFSNNCAPCHGAAGEGMAVAKAPAIAGLPEWYVKHQVDGFRQGLRGTHFDDIQGMRMRPMALTLLDDAEVAKVSAYVAALPRTSPAPQLTGGDATRGQGYYATCAACHGADGMGNEALGAPPLVGASDWYLRDQLEKFQTGVRGAHKNDVRGAQMAPMAKTLPDGQAIKDVLAHISTLPAK